MRKLALFLAWSSLITAGESQQQAEEFFESRVRPLLAKNCMGCHTATKMGGLEMRSRALLLKGGNSGPAIIPGDPDQSLLIRVVRHEHEKIKMPPSGRLQTEEIEVLRTWIRNGAVWPERLTAQTAAASGQLAVTPEQRAFWAFQPVRKPSIPHVKDTRWPQSPIDYFILAQLESKGLRPTRPADKRTLLRRLTFDLTGLPPTPEEMDEFLRDSRPDALRRVVDRLLASPRYGERWGRHWLDVARYSDDKLDPTGFTNHPNSWRYRNWVIEAFNHDMPYDLFIKAQIAGDLLPEPEKYAAGLGLYALSPEFTDDRVDVTTRGFLALTVACAQCHDHKYDPIPQTDYYALLGIFNNTRPHEFPLVPKSVEEAWNAKKRAVEDAQKAVDDYVQTQANQLAVVLASRLADYLMQQGEDLDQPTLERVKRYLARADLEHPYLKDFQAARDHAGKRTAAEKFQQLALAVYHEKQEIDKQNLIRLGGSMERSDLSQANLLSLERDKFILWRDLFGDNGILIYKRQDLERYLTGLWKKHLQDLEARAKQLKDSLPEKYPFLQTITDVEKPVKQRLYIRGDRENPGPEVPPRFLSILCEGEPKPFTRGSGRLELAEAIANEKNPLTARVMVNRIWQIHFGQGIVRTPSNFGQLGERPTHPELLDWLAARFMESGWSIKSLHREIVLSSTYQLSAASIAKNEYLDPENRLLWRFPRRRLEAEELRDALLFVAGTLDLSPGEAAQALDEKNCKRTVYGFVSRKKLDPVLALFDFPNPNVTSEQRMVTNVPLQGLFFLNSAFLAARAAEVSQRLGEGGVREKIRQAYRLLFQREPEPGELRLGEEYLRREGSEAWPRYLQVLMSSNEFLFIS